MTATDMIKQHILNEALNTTGVRNLDMYDYPQDLLTMDQQCCLQDAIEIFRWDGELTQFPPPYSRHYECDIRARELAEFNTWVAWPYYYGGGKHSDPSRIDWINDAFVVGAAIEHRPVRIFWRTDE